MKQAQNEKRTMVCLNGAPFGSVPCEVETPNYCIDFF